MPCNSSHWTSTRKSFMRAGIRGRTQSRSVSLCGACASPTLIYYDAYRSLLRTICSCTAPRERNFAPRYGHPPGYAHLSLGHVHHAFCTFLDNAPFTPYLSSSFALQPPTPSILSPTKSATRLLHSPLLLPFTLSKPCSFTLVLAKARTTHVALQYVTDGGKENGDETGTRRVSRVMGIQRPLYSVAALRSNPIKVPLYHNISFAACILRLQNGLFLDGASSGLATLDSEATAWLVDYLRVTGYETFLVSTVGLERIQHVNLT